MGSGTDESMEREKFIKKQKFVTKQISEKMDKQS
jgi:hypothetical protein